MKKMCKKIKSSLNNMVRKASIALDVVSAVTPVKEAQIITSLRLVGVFGWSLLKTNDIESRRRKGNENECQVNRNL